jgi:ubiquinone/menaquinone biosynthesis C-methylase UbiE/uncharacterized protein YbaR (Trm112 family)
MRRSLLEKISCPACSGTEFSCEVSREDGNEIREGVIICQKCGTHFAVQDGILNLLINPSHEITSEQEGWTILEKAVTNNDELMLSLPDAQGEHAPAWQGQASNFHYTFSEIGLQGNEQVLDLGSGRCWSTRYFAQKGCDAVGIDILLTKYVGLLTSDVYIKNENLYFDRVCGDMNKLPFQDGKFDIVFIAASLHHSSNIQRTLDESARVLKPGGKLVLTNEPVVDLFATKKLSCAEIDHGINEHVYRLLEYLTSLLRAGFRYRVIPYIGGYSRKITALNHIMVRTFPKQLMPLRIWPPLLYSQLLFRGGVLNLIAQKK